MQRKMKKVVLAFGLASGVGVVNPALPTSGLVQQAEARENRAGWSYRNPVRNTHGGRARSYSILRPRRLQRTAGWSSRSRFNLKKISRRYSACGATRRPTPTIGCGGYAGRRTYTACGATRRPTPTVGCGGYAGRRTYTACGATRRPTPTVGCGGYTGRTAYSGCGVTRRPAPTVGCGGYTGRRTYTACGATRRPAPTVGCGGFTGRRTYRAC